MDDVLVSGDTDETHLKNLHKVLTTLQNKGLKLEKEKFEYRLEKVEYLGYTISEKGISPSLEKVQDIKTMSAPTNKAELLSFIGFANFLRRFVPHFADIMAPLYALLKKDVRWKWTDIEEKTFNIMKDKISEQTILQHYSLHNKLILQTDASPIGIGAVLLQPAEDGKLLPVSHASRILQPAERNYSQLDREALAVIFGVTKFKQYLLGRHFTLMTDHKSLVSLFDPKKSVPQLSSARVKRWALLLAAYDYDIKYIPGKENCAADFLSRKPGHRKPSEEEQVPVQVLLIQEEQIINSKTVKEETAKDTILSKVLKFTKDGWSTQPDESMIPYFRKRLEITVEDDILMWDSRVIIPKSLQELLLKDLHAEHQGMVKMKQLARRYMWWPNIDKDIEQIVRACEMCQENAKSPTSATTASWSWPMGPWKRLHVDFAGPFLGKMFLVTVDAFSKFLDIIPMSQATSAATIQALRRLFSFFGLPEHIVTDNGSQFTSEEFKTFLSKNDILHTTTAPGHPATNGLAERYVGHFKTSMKKMGDKQEYLQVKLDRFLFTNRTTPNASDRSPAELLMNRQLRIRYAALKASQTQQQVKTFEKNLDKSPNFETGQAVFALNFGKGSKWIPGVITKTLSPRNFEVQVGDVIWKRHQDQIRPRHIPLKEPHPPGHGRETGPPRISGTGVSQPPENRQTQPKQVPRNAVRHTAPDRESRETDLTMVTANPETVNPEDNCRDCELEQLDKRNNIETGQSAAVTGYRENQTHLRRSERSRKNPERLIENI